MTKPTLHAVIIGINAYKSRPLQGCVNDALAVGTYFQKLCASEENQMGWQPHYLLAPSGEVEEKRVLAKPLKNIADFKSPTRDNIIAAFADFKTDLKDGDFCLLFYSGHGSYLAAPTVFEDVEPSGQLQTMVTIDSREPGKHDILDKELAYLIADVMDGREPSEKKKGVHFLVIMDCCYAGSNTRSADDSITARMESAGTFIPGTEAIYGFPEDPTKGNCFYQPFKQGQEKARYENLRHARYVNLAAARDTELAQEKTVEIMHSDGEGHGLSLRHGVFTYSLLTTLEQSGVSISYRELIRRVEMEVRSRVDQQIPILEMTETGDDNLLFLRNQFNTPKQEYEVGYREVNGIGEWFMNGGAIQGIVPSSEKQKTTVKVGKYEPWEVGEVRSSESILMPPSPPEEADKSNHLLRATIDQMAFPQVKIGFAKGLPEEQKNKIKEAWSVQKPVYLKLTGDNELPDYEVSQIQNLDKSFSFILTRPGSDIPLFIRHDLAATFLGDVDKVGKWEIVGKMSNPDTKIPADTIAVEIEKMEGVPFGPANLDSLFDQNGKPVSFVVKKGGADDTQDALSTQNPPFVALRYFNNDQPAIRVKINNTDKFNDYWVGALYLDSHFGIEHKYLDVQQIGFEGGKDHAQLSFPHKGIKLNSVPISVDEGYLPNGVVEIKDYIIVFVSKKKFDLEKYYQKSIKKDVNRAAEFDSNLAEDKDDWFTIKIPIQIYRPQEAKPVNNGGTVNFPGFKAIFPKGFTAKAQATNAASATRRAGALKKSKSAADTKGMLPPAQLWTETTGSEAVFKKTLATTPDNHISIIELTGIKGELTEENPLLIQPGDPLMEDEAIVPYVFDPVDKFYYPVGHSDVDGNVRISMLPSEKDGRIRVSDGVIGPDGIDEVLDADGKSLGGSIKLFFQKVVWGKLSGKHDYNKLTLLERADDGSLNRTVFSGNNQDALDKIKKAAAGGSVLLLLHGIIGDTEGQVEAVFQKSELYKKYKAVLAFDYENLNTPIEKTATLLFDWLTRCEIPDKSLTIVAHSMGGLVSRYMIENLGGDKLVNKLIQAGTPNAGSEIDDFRKQLNGWIALGLNGVPAFKPYLTVASFIWKGIENSLFHTLGQMSPSSDFLVKQLNLTGKTATGVPYFLIAGDTTNIEAVYDQNDPFWRKLWACITDRGHYIFIDLAIFSNNPNDMAVRVGSMKQLPWGNIVDVKEIPCDHVSYFVSAKSLAVLAEMV